MNKKIVFAVLVFLIPALFFVSCDPDDDNPFADARDKYLGSWMVQDNGKKMTYEVQITLDPGNSSQVLISNFHNLGKSPYAIVTTGTITVPQQTLVQGITAYGSGTYSSGKINWLYYVDSGADLDTIQAVYTKL